MDGAVRVSESPRRTGMDDPVLANLGVNPSIGNPEIESGASMLERELRRSAEKSFREILPGVQ